MCGRAKVEGFVSSGTRACGGDGESFGIQYLLEGFDVRASGAEGEISGEGLGWCLRAGGNSWSGLDCQGGDGLIAKEADGWGNAFGYLESDDG